MEEVSAGKRRRPNPIRWLLYCFGMGLPERNREWVLYDVTGPTWVYRHLIRVLVQIALPIAAVFLFIPAPLWVKILIVVAAGPPVLLFSSGYIVEMADSRLSKAGYDPTIGERIRKQRKADSLEKQKQANARRREKAAARLERH